MFKYTLRTRTPQLSTIHRATPTTRSIITNTFPRMQHSHGQDASHATGDSVVPNKVQEKAPQGLEEGLPNSVHDTGSQNQAGGGGQGKTHAKDGGDASIVPKGIQKAVPEKVERALPNAIHDTGDKH